jgi:uncharacterized protein with PCYCGC motif
MHRGGSRKSFAARRGGAILLATNRSLASATLVSFVLISMFLAQGASSRSPQDPGVDVPAYHAQPPQGVLPATMSPQEFAYPVVKNAYAAAARVKKALYQQPCYCHCDRSEGHVSLLDCFASKHGSGCGTCILEAFYTYEQTRKGKTPSQIREGIKGGEWKTVDLNKYQKPLAAK